MSRGDFWSRRKAAVEAEARAEEGARRAAERAETEAALAERSDEELLEELGLPDPDTLDNSEDVRKFLTEAVPNRLKTRALRKLWTMNPVLANLDGLVDYGEDFTDGAKVIQNLQTAYQVGKGMTAHVLDLEEKARQAEQALEEDPEAESPAPQMDDAEEEPVALAQAEPATPDANAAETPATEPARAPEDEAHLPAPSRRMRFHFDDLAQRTGPDMTKDPA